MGRTTTLSWYEGIPMPAPDSRLRRTGRHPEIVLTRATNLRVARDRTRELDDLADMMRTGPPENGVARHNFATIDDAANTLGLTAEQGRVARRLIGEVAADARELLSITKSAREAGIPQPAIVEMIRRGMDLRGRFQREESTYLAKAAADPVGTVRRRSDGRQYRKVGQGKWVPHGQSGGARGADGAAGGSPPKKKDESPGRRTKTEPEPQPQGKHDPEERRNGKTASERFAHLQRMANAAGKQIHGKFDDGKHGHEHMDKLERQLKQHIANGLSAGEEPPADEAGAGAPPSADETAGAAPPDPEAEATKASHGKKLESMHHLGSAFRTREQKILDRVWHAVKHTAEEFPAAGKALGKLRRGEKLSKHDMEAVVSVGAMIGTTAIVASGYGAMAGGAVLSQKFLTHVAMAALSSHLNTAYTAYAGLGFVKKLAHVAEGYVHGGVPGAAYHAGEAVLAKADTDDDGDVEVKKLAKGMIREMAKILDHDWTPEEIAAAERGPEGALGNEGDEGDGDEALPEAAGSTEQGDEGEEAPSGPEGGDDGTEDDGPRPNGHDSPAQPHEQHRQTQEVHDAVAKLDGVERRIDSKHQKGMLKELRDQAAEVTKDPSPQAIEWLNKRIDSFLHLVTGISAPGDEAEAPEEPPVKKSRLFIGADGRLLMKSLPTGAGPMTAPTRGIAKGDDEPDDEELEDPTEDVPDGPVRPVGFRPVLTPPMAKAQRKAPPPPPPPRSQLIEKSSLGVSLRAPHPVNEYGHRDGLEPGMILHPRDRHADAGPIEVLDDGRFKLGDDIIKGPHALLTQLYGTANHRTTARRYFKLGGERRAIPRADVLHQLRGLLKSEGVVVQRAGDGYNLTGDLRKAGIPEYLMTTGNRSVHVEREAAFDLCRLLGAANG